MDLGTRCDPLFVDFNTGKYFTNIAAWWQPFERCYFCKIGNIQLNKVGTCAGDVFEIWNFENLELLRFKNIETCSISFF